MKTILSTAMLAGLLAMGGVAAAQPKAVPSLELAAGAPFKHRHSGVTFPGRLAGFARTKALELEADQLDILVEYEAPDKSAAFTLYIYRIVAGSPAIWFDRARVALEQRRDALGTATLHKEAAFVPPGRKEASGLIATYGLSGSAYRSTGVAIAPAGEWLVKLRASSSTHSPAELEAGMKAALAEVGWPSGMVPAPAAALVAPCTTMLAASKKARPAPKGRTSTEETLLGAIVNMAAAADGAPKRREPEPNLRWCRDSTQMAEAGVYRAGEQTDGYLLALGDAGRAATAGRSNSRALLEAVMGGKKARGRDRSPPRYVVDLVLLSETRRSALLDRLPPPAQALEILKKGSFATSFTTWGKDRNQITISNDFVK